MIRHGSANTKRERGQCSCGQGPDSSFHLVFCKMFESLGSRADSGVRYNNGGTSLRPKMGHNF